MAGGDRYMSKDGEKLDLCFVQCFALSIHNILNNQTINILETENTVNLWAVQES